MSDNSKMQVSIYQIDPSQFAEDDTYNEIVNTIIKNSNSKGEKYGEITVSSNVPQEYNIRLFHCEKINPPKWQSFLKKILIEDSKLKAIYNKTHSFLLFVGYNEKVYVISGGSGSFEIERYVSQTFGIDILTCLIEKNSKVIKAIQNRGVTGALLGQAKFYRGDQKLSDQSDFGIIYKEVKFDLDRTILINIFGFKEEDLKRRVAGCLAKTSFQINKTLDFDTFLKVVAKLDQTFEKGPNFSINNVHLISRKKKANDALIGYLNQTLYQTLYDNCIAENTNDFDFCHKEFEKFLTASYFKIPHTETPIDFESPMSFDEVIRELRSHNMLYASDVIEFKHMLAGTQLISSDPDGNILTRGNLLDHLHGEITYNSKTYFFIDGEWYMIEESFIKELNDSCKDLMVQFCDNDLITKPFAIKEKERDFNSKFIGEEGLLVFDTITPENIEPCDILKYNDQSVYMIHVKKGFNNSIRDLTAQISIAAKRIRHDRKAGGYKYINELEAKVKRGSRSKSHYIKRLSTQVFPATGLKSIFESKRNINISFCLAFVDVSGKTRSLKNNVELFESNIAKYSLIELSREIGGLGFDFKIIQLNN
jgi:uncharacterized protein (TIGR04141 family)